MIQLKSLTAGLTALSLVSAIGFAYAQSTPSADTTTPPAATGSDMMNSGTPSTTDSTTSGTTTMPAEQMPQDNAPLTERAPQTDRN